jgi:hypothetical protein
VTALGRLMRHLGMFAPHPAGMPGNPPSPHDLPSGHPKSSLPILGPIPTASSPQTGGMTRHQVIQSHPDPTPAQRCNQNPTVSNPQTPGNDPASGHPKSSLPILVPIPTSSSPQTRGMTLHQVIQSHPCPTHWNALTPNAIRSKILGMALHQVIESHPCPTQAQQSTQTPSANSSRPRGMTCARSSKVIPGPGWSRPWTVPLSPPRMTRCDVIESHPCPPRSSRTVAAHATRGPHLR